MSAFHILLCGWVVAFTAVLSVIATALQVATYTNVGGLPPSAADLPAPALAEHPAGAGSINRKGEN